MSVRVGLAKKKIDKGKAKRILSDAIANKERREKEFDVTVRLLPFLQEECMSVIMN